MVDKMNKRRLGIFVFFDKDGIVDDYIVYLLDELYKILERLIIVCNGALLSEGKAIFERYTDEIFLRENVGFDAAAWQFALIEKVGFEELENYDQLILLNDTFYGPFYSFEDMFFQMDAKKVDFWGITIHGKTDDGWGICEYGYLPEHIQSYFIVYENKLITSDIFETYWKSLPIANSFSEAVCFNEARQTKFFADAGYSYSVLCDTRDLENGYSYSDNHYIYNPFMLIKNFNCPILKRKVFLADRIFLLETNSTYEVVQVLHYLEQETNYNINLIYKHLMRLTNPLLFKDFFNLNYIVQEKNLNLPSLNIAIIVKISNVSTSDIFIRWLAHASELADYFIICINKEICEYCQRLFKSSHVYFFEDKAGDDLFYWQPYVSYFKEYDYFGFFDDEFFSKRAGRSFSVNLGEMDVVWGNMLKNKMYICNIIDLFLSDRKLCMLASPNYFFGKNLSSSIKPWTKETKDYIQKIKPYGFILDESIWKCFPYVSNGNIWATKSFVTIVMKLSFTKDFIRKCKNKNNARLFLLQITPYFLKKFGLYGGNIIAIDYAQVMLQNHVCLIRAFSSWNTFFLLAKAYLKKYIPYSVLRYIKFIKRVFHRINFILKKILCLIIVMYCNVLNMN